MNTHSHHHSRLFCRLIRFISSGTGLPPTRHLARCEDCRAYFVAEAKLEGSLRRAARRPAADIPAGLEDRILHSISYPAPAARRPATVRRLPWVLSLTGVAAALVAALILFRSPHEPARFVEHESTTDTPRVETSEQTVDTLDAWRQRIVNLNPTSPLELEIDAVRADTRSALRFLALNFLPGEPEVLVPREARRT